MCIEKKRSKWVAAFDVKVLLQGEEKIETLTLKRSFYNAK
jgi:hypothetical protein